MTRRLSSSVALAALAVLMMGCSDAAMRFPVTTEGQKALPADVSVIRVGPQNFAGLSLQADANPSRTALPDYRPGEYRIGPGDEISIFVFDHPELAIPAGKDQVTTGYLVSVDGTLNFPFIGSVDAKGKTVAQLRDELTLRIAKFFPAPQVDVRIAKFNSQRVVVGGAVQTPITTVLGATHLTLLESINAAGGLAEDADPRKITVRRGGQSYTVDLEAYLTGGVNANNPYLRAGDVVSVPRKALREAYVLGEVVEPATVDLTSGNVTLTQALARQGGIDEIRADARGIFVFRFVEGRMTVYQLDTSMPTALLMGTRFAILPEDVIYVTRSPLQNWNDTISSILPSVSVAKTARDF